MMWVNHINKLKSECYKRLNIIKVLSSTKWGADRKCLLNSYRALIRQKIDYASIIYDSAKKRTLNSLEAVQNQALRLCIGAFRTSPTMSILAEAEEMPLEFRRKELVIMYGLKILSRCNSPTYNYYTQSLAVDSEYEQQPKLSQPLRIRAAKYIKELNFMVPPVFIEQLPPFGPWKNYELPINLELINGKKENTYEFLFNEIINKYADYEKIYTYSSVENNQSSCSVVKTNICYKFKLSNLFSMFSSDATAIIKALQIISNDNSPQRKYIILTKSKSCLTAISKLKTKIPIIIDIQLRMINLLQNNYTFEILCIPGGLKAEAEAIINYNEIRIQCSNKTTYSDIKRHIKHKIRYRWDVFWKTDNSSKLFSIRKSIFDKLPLHFLCRYDQVVATRLRIGHTNITHIHIITKSEKSKCKCGSFLSIFHLLVECSEYNTEKCFCNLPSTLNECLNNENGCIATLKFLKMINLYKLI